MPPPSIERTFTAGRLGIGHDAPSTATAPARGRAARGRTRRPAARASRRRRAGAEQLVDAEEPQRALKARRRSPPRPGAARRRSAAAEQHLDRARDTDELEVAPAQPSSRATLRPGCPWRNVMRGTCSPASRRTRRRSAPPGADPQRPYGAGLVVEARLPRTAQLHVGRPAPGTGAGANTASPSTSRR